MAIYTRLGNAVKLTAARLIPVWIEQRRDAIGRHYAKPTKVRRGSRVDELAVWHVQARYVGSGEPVFDGKWLSCGFLVANGDWKEIQAELEGLNQADHDKWNEWNKAGAPEASHFFLPADDKELVGLKSVGVSRVELQYFGR